VAIADLTTAGRDRLVAEPNVFWSSDDLLAALERHQCRIDPLACCEPGAGLLADVQQAVSDEIERRFSRHPTAPRLTPIVAGSGRSSRAAG
jgi:hypothetical protein